MSAYLHYGMVSPLRIAREAARIGGPGTEKYLDELLIWRELAYAFCFYRPNHETLDALPRWAQETLRSHQADPRPALFDWESLARGRTGDPLWDLAQKSLLVHGELHNNVRMTWGKALVNWTSSASDALEAMIVLNHRYALDGRDPASYAGLLWCLGQFDRPHAPPQKIFGTVRTRPTDWHAARLDLDRYAETLDQRSVGSRLRVAVIGAGISGLSCARTLMDHGLDVVVFDKSKGVGGRLATRRADPDLSFDHGAQYFTARSPGFQRQVHAWQAQGLVAEWTGRIVEIQGDQIQSKLDQPKRFVGLPRQTALSRHLAEELKLRLETRISRMERTPRGWSLTDEMGVSHALFDSAAVTLPSPQAAELLGEHPFAEQARNVPMTPCWAAMFAFDRPVNAAWDGAFVHESPIAWLARNNSKPGRPSAPECWVLHASTDWSAAHLDSSGEAVLAELLEAFRGIIKRRLEPPIHANAHRWKFSATPLSLDTQAFFDPRQSLAVCGDWLAGGRVEGAYRSGMAAAGWILRTIGLAHDSVPPR
jgi:predicted NAD/FAD-dependent oxidoreductase